MKNTFYTYSWTVLVALFVGFNASGQEFTYKAETGLKIAFSHEFDPSSERIEVAYLTVKAPKPLTKDLTAKKQKDYLKFHAPLAGRRQTDSPREDSLITPENTSGFVGASRAGTPNDNHLAISNDGMVVSVLNQTILCYNEKGELLKNWGLSFMTSGTVSDKPEGTIPTLNRTYDPKVLYDPINDRFIIVFLNGVTDTDSRILVAFSQSNDPTDKWNLYSLEGNPLAQTDIWTDYPIIASTKEDFFVTVNLLEEGKSWQEGFQQSIIWQVSKEDGFNGDTLNSTFWHDIKYNGKPLWSICPVQGGMEQAEKEIYFLTVRPSDAENDSVFLHHIDNTLSSGIAKFSVKQLVADKPYGVPATAFQPKEGFRLQTNDARVLSGFIHEDVIQYVQTSSNDVNLNSSVFHGKIYDVKGTPKVYGEVIYRDSIEFGYPSICYAGNGGNDHSAAITFSHVSKWVNPGTSVVYCDRYGQYSPIVQVREGDSIINSFIADTSERWGDYTNIQRRYNKPGEIWAVGSFGDEAGTAGTWVAQLIIKDSKVYAVENKDRLAKAFPIPSLNQTVHIELQAKENVNYTFEVYDMVGKKVMDATRDGFQEGMHLVTFNNVNLRPGIYQLKIFADGSEINSEKIIFQ